jgi:hypothetical protein
MSGSATDPIVVPDVPAVVHIDEDELGDGFDVDIEEIAEVPRTPEVRKRFEIPKAPRKAAGKARVKDTPPAKVLEAIALLQDEGYFVCKF